MQLDLFATRRHAKPGGLHGPRERLTRHTPVHVTLRVAKLSSSLRARDVYRAIRTATSTVWRTQPMRLVHASVQSNHIHLLVEAADKLELARGMQGFQISAAKHINRTLARKGRVFPDRYHVHILRSLREAKNATAYVLNNWRKHGVATSAPFDPCSTAHAFAGWLEADSLPADSPPVQLAIWPPQSWLLQHVGDLSAFG
ncbi:MAG TPA: transposase [Kofleriaceae bacterium]|jgi:REP element-mobilizing transposase RayT